MRQKNGGVCTWDDQGNRTTPLCLATIDRLNCKIKNTSIKILRQTAVQERWDVSCIACECTHIVGTGLYNN